MNQSFEGAMEYQDGSVVFQRFAQLDSDGKLTVSTIPDFVTSGMSFNGTYSPVEDDINPEYQGKGIGIQLIEMVKEKYKEYLRVILIAYDKEIPFYQNYGFEVGEDKSPMFITSLWT